MALLCATVHACIRKKCAHFANVFSRVVRLCVWCANAFLTLPTQLYTVVCVVKRGRVGKILHFFPWLTLILRNEIEGARRSNKTTCEPKAEIIEAFETTGRRP